MTETPCFLGITTVRIGTRLLAFLQFWLQFLYLVLLVVRYIVQWHNQIDDDIDGDDDKTTNTYNELDFDISQFSQISGTILVMYSSYYLQKATYNHNLQYINFWMILNSINFITSVAFIVFASLRIGRFDIFITGLIGCLWEGYKLFVVYQFYVDEISSTATDTVQHTTTQNIPTNNVDQSQRDHTVEFETSTRTNDLHY